MRLPRMTRIAVAGILMSVSLPAFADIIKGTVLDENGEPAIGVNISVLGGKATAVTDIDGNYS
ncbi:MAG: carboxypeptidase-like regulatory domain-containing protein, partial [Muribaculaceae bacterium]|nr:carboxypeptidase-like regulatory domain-containing protein [Muribaculaceae bacterium]